MSEVVTGKVVSVDNTNHTCSVVTGGGRRVNNVAIPGVSITDRLTAQNYISTGRKCYVNIPDTGMPTIIGYITEMGSHPQLYKNFKGLASNNSDSDFVLHVTDSYAAIAYKMISRIMISGGLHPHIKLESPEINTTVGDYTKQVSINKQVASYVTSLIESLKLEPDVDNYFIRTLRSGSGSDPIITTSIQKNSTPYYSSIVTAKGEYSSSSITSTEYANSKKIIITDTTPEGALDKQKHGSTVSYSLEQIKTESNNIDTEAKQIWKLKVGNANVTIQNDTIVVKQNDTSIIVSSDGIVIKGNITIDGDVTVSGKITSEKEITSMKDITGYNMIANGKAYSQRINVLNSSEVNVLVTDLNVKLQELINTFNTHIHTATTTAGPTTPPNVPLLDLSGVKPEKIEIK